MAASRDNKYYSPEDVIGQIFSDDEVSDLARKTDTSETEIRDLLEALRSTGVLSQDKSEREAALVNFFVLETHADIEDFSSCMSALDAFSEGWDLAVYVESNPESVPKALRDACAESKKRWEEE